MIKAYEIFTYVYIHIFCMYPPFNAAYISKKIM